MATDSKDSGWFRNSADGVKRAVSQHTISQAKRLRGHVEGCAIAKNGHVYHVGSVLGGGSGNSIP